ncbi:ABC transporter permease [Acuticoccus sediminis]|uniref:ABC transporter permease n=1 Tax=Acuticoccus sediminis TaxID=2184697 RepID=A0A8B2NL39_9HYPH|nr:ABC transporter permease [Acuticoccus sediminis]RAH96767.1 ABC transporter permease [Acuticoccus sediminis]
MRSAALRGLIEVVVPPLAFFLIVLACWDVITAAGFVDPLMLPSPRDVANQLHYGFSSGIFWPHIGTTLAETLIALAISIVLGVASAAFVAQSEELREVANPILVAFEAFPKIALAPLAITWFGYGIGSKVYLATAIAYFPVLIATLAGLGAVPAGQQDLFRALGASRMQTLIKLKIPYALPYILSGVNIAAIAALIGSIVAEFAGSRAGLGRLILYANEVLATDRVFAILIVLSSVGISLHFATQFARRRLTSWAS